MITCVILKSEGELEALKMIDVAVPICFYNFFSYFIITLILP